MSRGRGSLIRTMPDKGGRGGGGGGGRGGGRGGRGGGEGEGGGLKTHHLAGHPL